MGPDVLVRRQDTKALSLCTQKKNHVSVWLEGTSAAQGQKFHQNPTLRHLDPALLAYRNM